MFSQPCQVSSADLDGRSILTVHLADDLLQAALRREREVLDERLCFEAIASEPELPTQRSSTRPFRFDHPAIDYREARLPLPLAPGDRVGR